MRYQHRWNLVSASIVLGLLLAFGLGLLLRSQTHSAAQAQQPGAPPANPAVVPTIAPPPTAVVAPPAARAQRPPAPAPSHNRISQATLYLAQQDIRALDQFTLSAPAAAPSDTLEWAVQDGVLRQTGRGAASLGFGAASLGEATWTDLQFSAAVWVPKHSHLTGITFRRVDALNFYALVLQPRQNGRANVALYRWADGQPELIAEAATAAIQAETWYTLGVTVRGSQIVGSVNGATVLTADDATYAAGAVGVIATSDPDAAFTEFLVLP